MLQPIKGISNIIAVATITPQHTPFQTELGLTSQVPKAGRMMKRGQEFRATAKLPKLAKTKVNGYWPSTWSTTENRATGHPRETKAKGQAEL